MVGRHCASTLAILLWVVSLCHGAIDINDRGGWHFASRVEPIKAEADGFSFVTLGDWGCGQGNARQRRVAHTLARFAEQHNVRFIISTGDNFYPRGVDSVEDPQWRTTFENVYQASALQCRWYICGGNHDDYSNLTAQLRYTRQSARWWYPNFYYTESIFEVPADQPVTLAKSTSRPLIDLIVLDGTDTHLTRFALIHIIVHSF
jgi:hypothetical protein